MTRPLPSLPRSAFVEVQRPYSAEPEGVQAKLALFDADAKAARAWLDKYFVTEVDRIDSCACSSISPPCGLARARPVDAAR
ncbi:MAG: hypothetical protein ACLSVD_03500 [Eggerthellaceae bacterium]